MRRRVARARWLALVCAAPVLALGCGRTSLFAGEEAQAGTGGALGAGGSAPLSPGTAGGGAGRAGGGRASAGASGASAAGAAGAPAGGEGGATSDCPPDDSLCDGSCVDPQADDSYCGAGPDCAKNPGQACSDNETCVSGQCVLDCPVDRLACDGTCVDPQTAAEHCGAGPDCDEQPGVACDASEQCKGGVCVQRCIFDTSLLPVTVHPGGFNYGQLAFDGDCQLLVAGADYASVYRVDPTTGAVTNAGGTFSKGNSVNAVTYRPSDGLIYVGVNTGGHVYTLDDNGTATFVIDVPDYVVHALAVAPEGFGDIGGQILVAGYGLYVVDPAGPTVTTLVGGAGTLHPSLAFAPDGKLYAANYWSNVLESVSPSGVVTTVAKGFDGLDGLAMDPSGARLFAANCWASPTRVDQVALPGGAASSVADIYLNAGSYTSGMLMDDAGTLLVLTVNGSNSALDYLTP